MKKILMICMLGILIGIGCSTQKQEQKEASVSKVKDFGEVLYTFTEENDVSAWNSFVKEKSQYQKATIKIITYTTEGDPIITTLTKDKDGYMLTIDSSADGYRGHINPIVSKSFKYLHSMNGQEYSDAIKESYIICFSEDPAFMDYWFLSDYPKVNIFKDRDINIIKTPTFIMDPYNILVTKRK
ncbi:DUF4362 domain-containing protein [Amedibacillus sp. YH-ame10]